MWEFGNVGIWKVGVRGYLRILRTTWHNWNTCQEFLAIRAARGLLWGSGMNQQQLRDRTKSFAIQIVRLCRNLAGDWDVRELARQLLRSGTAVAANYRACGRARSDEEFCSKIAIVVEEADESQLWLELLPEAESKLATDLHKVLLAEASELTAIFTATYRTARSNLEKRKAEQKKGRAK
jgi:four helix bundle protein